MSIRSAVVGVILLVATPLVSAHAQCPDGTPAPCGVRRAAPAPNSVAVLVFENVERDTSLVWLGDGLAEDVATELGAVPGMVVRGAGIVRSASRAAEGDAHRIAQLVSVHYVVEGSYHNVGSHVRVAVRLLAMPAGDERWGRIYDQSRDSLSALSSAIATGLATALGTSARPSARRAPDPQAYEAYERGWFFFLRQDPATARTLFERAIQRDSTFAPAWAGLAMAWGELADTWVAPLEAYPRAREAAHRALALDSSIASAYVALSGVAEAIDEDWGESLRLADRAIALDSTLPDAWVSRGFALAALRRGPEALAAGQHAWDLDSLSAHVGVYLTSLTYLVAPMQAQAALAQVRGRLDPVYVAAWEANIALQRGDCATAERLLRPWVRQIHLGYVMALACSGRRAEGDSILRAGLADTARGYVNPVSEAEALLALGDRDNAIRWLERGVEERTAYVMSIHLNPFLAPLRGDPRFVALERRLGLVP